MSIRDSYDSAARAYADHLSTELEQKPLDRHLLNRFAEATRGRGLVADLGCGPGHVARYLRDQGVLMTGIDLSPEMIRVAADLNPGIDFRVGDMGDLHLDDARLAGVVAFYSIVHFDSAGLGAIFGRCAGSCSPTGWLWCRSTSEIRSSMSRTCSARR